MLNLRCVSVKYWRRFKKGVGRKKKQVDIIGNYENGIKRKTGEICSRDKKLPAASNAVGSKRINKSVPFIF